MNAINALHPEGSTNVAAGLQIGYDMAQKNHRDEGITRVIVLSDGVANVGTVDPEGILKLIKDGVERRDYTEHDRFWDGQLQRCADGTAC